MFIWIFYAHIFIKYPTIDTHILFQQNKTEQTKKNINEKEWETKIKSVYIQPSHTNKKYIISNAK